MEWLIIIFILILSVLWYFKRPQNPLKPGQTAPNFSLTDQHGQTHTLDEFRGKWLVLYFYPKDDTPGCTKQACAFRDHQQRILELGAEVLGVSIDNQHSHTAFAQKFHLNFPLLADDEAVVSKKYFSLVNLGFIKFALRNTFLIDPNGKIAQIFLSASATRNSTEIIEALKRQQATFPGNSFN